MKHARVKIPLFVIAIVFLVFAFVGLFHNDENSRLLSPALFFKLTNSCSSQETKGSDPVTSAKKKTKSDLTNNGSSKEEIDKTNNEDEDFLENKCDVTKGKWVFNNFSEPLYSNQSCPYIDKQVSCVKNGRMDSDYRHWEWQPDDCVLPRFGPQVVLDKLRCKRLMFVGDSVQRNQWKSFVFLVQSVIPP